MTSEPRAGLTEEEVLKLPFPVQDGERVLRLTRRHWWFLWPMTAILLVILIVPVVGAWFILDEIGVRDELGFIWWVIAALWVVFWGLRLLFNWYQYHHDLWVVTNQRIIDSRKRHPFSMRLSTADLVNVQDISVDKSGITPTILNYGSVVCETAGTGNSDFIIAGVPHPEEIQLLIDRERDRERNRIRGADTV